VLAIPPETAGESCSHESIEIWADATLGRGGERTSMRGRCIACGEGLLRTREAGAWARWRAERGPEE
jgi:hypothetical protein